jgi:hypothetical protein
MSERIDISKPRHAAIVGFAVVVAALWIAALTPKAAPVADPDAPERIIGLSPDDPFCHVRFYDDSTQADLVAMAETARRKLLSCHAVVVFHGAIEFKRIRTNGDAIAMLVTARNLNR